MKNVWRIEMEYCKSNDTWWNKIVNEPKYDIHLLKNNVRQGTIAFSRTREQANDIQEIVLTSFHFYLAGQENVNEFTIV